MTVRCTGLWAVGRCAALRAGPELVEGMTEGLDSCFRRNDGRRWGECMRFMGRVKRMGEEEYYQQLDLSGRNALVRNVLRWMQVRTVGQLLELKERQLLSMKRCGPKTTARILQLQAEYGKDVTETNPREDIGEVLADSRRYVNGLIAVAIVANEVVEGAQRDGQNRYYCRVTTKRLNMLQRVLEALREQ